jgi:hypothetical protein
MAISYKIRAEGVLLHVEASGNDDSLEQVKQYGLAIIDAAIAHEAKRVLCDERALEYALGTFDTFEAAKFIAAMAPKVARIAIVCKPKHIEAGDFWETVAVNRGLQVRIFTDIDEAHSWLINNDTSSASAVSVLRRE